MAQPKTWSLFLIAIQLFGALTPSNAFHMFGGGGGGGDDLGELAEMLAAGLVTKMLMDDLSGGGGNGGGGGRSSMLQSLRHQVTSRFNLRAPNHLQSPSHHHQIQHMVAPRPAYPPMMAPRRPPMMHPYPVPPHILHHHHRHHQFMMAQALMQQAHQHALATAWNNEYRALHGSETMVRSAFPALVPIEELLSDEDTLSVVTILLNSDLLDDSEDEEPEVQAKEEVQKETRTEEEPEFDTSSSENESRYILPRIVRHFVQRIMRRVEHQ